jgi:hypothetical protein
VNYQTLNSFIKEKLKAKGVDIPSEPFNLFIGKKAEIKKEKEKPSRLQKRKRDGSMSKAATKSTPAKKSSGNYNREEGRASASANQRSFGDG